MGEADRFKEYRLPKKRFFKSVTEGAVPSLITINVIGFVLLLFLQVSFLFGDKTLADFYSTIIGALALPGDFTTFLHKPWTILSFMFTEIGAEYWRIITNMVWLYAFGSLLVQYTSNDKVIPIYIYGGFVGAIVFLIAVNLVPQMKMYGSGLSLLGANAGVMAIAMAITTLAPGHRFFTQIRGGIPLWVLMIIYIFIDIAGAGSFFNPYVLAHLGGALAGFLFVYALKKDIDLGTWMVKIYHYFTTALTPLPTVKQPKEKVFYNTGNRKPYQKYAIVTQERIDEILDKISVKGYGSLSREEKAILKKASDEDGI